jgi:hypothetical protein
MKIEINIDDKKLKELEIYAKNNNFESVQELLIMAIDEILSNAIEDDNLSEEEKAAMKERLEKLGYFE